MNPTVPVTPGRARDAHRSGPVGIGLIGTGMISETYLEQLGHFPDLRVVILGNRTRERARAAAEKHGVDEWGSTDDVLAHSEVELVVNLTTPATHASMTSAALAAGKHVWSEKPISTDRPSARALLEQATAAGLLLGVAPDTVLGPGLQTARRLIARGDIGTPLSAQTAMQYPGPDLFHPNPEFLFTEGAGPLFDIGPYFLTALVHIFGPFTEVAAMGSTSRTVRTIQVGDRAGVKFPVTVPTHVVNLARFGGGGVAQSIFSFDSPLARFGVFEITGTEGTMVLPDPNMFTGEIRTTRSATFENMLRDPEWTSISAAPPADVGRGIGVLDMARCIRTGERPLASGELAYHILDTMIAIDDAITSGQTVEVTSAVDPVPLVEEGWDPYKATLVASGVTPVARA